MKNRCYSLLLFVLSCTTVVCAQDDEYNGMKGTEAPVFQESSETDRCYVFNKYVVRTDQNEDAGEIISVYSREASISVKNACQTADKSAYLDVKDSDEQFFYGVSGSLLFIDSGTSVESRGLQIFDLTSRKSVFNDSYSGDPKLIDGRFVVFDSPSEKKGSLATCKQAAKWKRDGGDVGWVQVKRLDVQTLKVINVGALRCVYMQ